MPKKIIYAEDAIDAFESADIERKGFALNDYEFGYNSGLSRAVDIIEDLPSAQPLTEEDYIELRDRFGDEVEAVVRDMVSGEGKRWMT